MDKASGKSEKIVITNDKGRLSKEEIEKMVHEAEKFKSQDDELKGKVESKNALENYCFQMKNQLGDEKLSVKFTPEDKATIEAASADGLQFVNSATEASKEDYDAKMKELEGKFNPIMMRIYQETGGAQGGMPGAQKGPSGPQADVDDLD